MRRFGGVPALSGVSATFPAGSITALLGPNGSGKSTLLRVLAGVLDADAGGVTVGGAPPPRGPARYRRVAWIAQDPQLDPDMTVGATLALMASLFAAPAGAVDAALQRFGLDPAKVVRACSGGQRRRLHVALGLLHDPDVVLLDEPFVGLDAELRGLLWGELARAAERGAAVVLSTHDLAGVEERAHRVVVLVSAAVAAAGTPRDLADAHGFAGVEVQCGEDVAIPGAEPVSGGLLVRNLAPAAVAEAIAAQGGDVASMTVLRPGLASAYRAIVGAAPGSARPGGGGGGGHGRRGGGRGGGGGGGGGRGGGGRGGGGRGGGGRGVRR